MAPDLPVLRATTSVRPSLQPGGASPPAMVRSCPVTPDMKPSCLPVSALTHDRKC
jgi:hypothetical protein